MKPTAARKNGTPPRNESPAIISAHLWWPFPSYGRRQWLAATALFLAYLIAAQLGVHSYSAPSVISPASGIALAMFMLEGLALWPAIVLASIANYLIVGMPLPSIVILTVANSLT